MIRAGDSIENPVTGERTVRLPFPPAVVQRIGLALGSPLGRVLGYEPVYVPAPAPAGAPAATAAA